MQTKVFIATPTAGYPRPLYVSSLAGMISALGRTRIRTQYANARGTSIDEQRDVLAQIFLKGDASHLLFVDDDMQFPPDLAAKMLGCEQPMVGTIYAKREMPISYIVKPIDGQITVTDGLAEVAAIGFGFVLLRRDCVERVAANAHEYPSRAMRERIRAIFRPIDLPNGAQLSEDLAFCRRWRDCGGKVFAYADADIKHVGDYAYGEPFGNYLRTGQTP